MDETVFLLILAGLLVIRQLEYVVEEVKLQPQS